MIYLKKKNQKNGRKRRNRSPIIWSFFLCKFYVRIKNTLIGGNKMNRIVKQVLSDLEVYDKQTTEDGIKRNIKNIKYYLYIYILKLIILQNI